MLVHSVVPQAGQERPGERLDFFVNCRCRMEAWQALFAQLGIAAEIRPITVIRACPEFQVVPDTKWRTLAQHPACNDCQGWQQEWLGLFLPDTTSSDIRPLAAAHGINLDIHVQPCGACPLAQNFKMTQDNVEISAEQLIHRLKSDAQGGTPHPPGLVSNPAGATKFVDWLLSDDALEVGRQARMQAAAQQKPSLFQKFLSFFEGH